MRKRGLLWAAAAAAIATALAGGIAWGAIPGAGGVIHGCYHKTEGQLRVIDPGTDSCRPPEIPIAWNEQGVRGEKGDKGDPGTPGRDGVDGHNGTGVTVEPEAPGVNCAAGGVKVTASNGSAYICNGLTLPPDPGKD
jgi:hypothetical protein